MCLLFISYNVNSFNLEKWQNYDCCTGVGKRKSVVEKGKKKEYNISRLRNVVVNEMYNPTENTIVYFTDIFILHSPDTQYVRFR